MHYLDAKQHISYESLPHIVPQRKRTNEASNTSLCQAASQETWFANKMGCIVDWVWNSADDRLSTKAARDSTSEGLYIHQLVHFRSPCQECSFIGLCRVAQRSWICRVEGGCATGEMQSLSWGWLQDTISPNPGGILMMVMMIYGGPGVMVLWLQPKPSIIMTSFWEFHWPFSVSAPLEFFIPLSYLHHT